MCPRIGFYVVRYGLISILKPPCTVSWKDKGYLSIFDML